jgi:hypothetical protein
VPYIIYNGFYLGMCMEKFDEGHSTTYLISSIRCNNILIYAVPYPCGPDVDVNTIGTNISRLL